MSKLARTLPVVLPAALLAAACSEYDLGVTTTDLGLPPECPIDAISPEDTVPVESCADLPGGFEPVVEWGAGDGRSSRSVPAVADLNGDGLPEIIANFTSGLLPGGLFHESNVLTVTVQ